MDPFKVVTILMLFAGIAIILVAAGFAVLAMRRPRSTEAGRVAEAPAGRRAHG